jgi:hypothetical protein
LFDEPVVVGEAVVQVGSDQYPHSTLLVGIGDPQDVDMAHHAGLVSGMPLAVQCLEVVPEAGIARLPVVA